jgi:hypothetical protein
MLALLPAVAGAATDSTFTISGTDQKRLMFVFKDTDGMKDETVANLETKFKDALPSAGVISFARVSVEGPLDDHAWSFVAFILRHYAAQGVVTNVRTSGAIPAPLTDFGAESQLTKSGNVKYKWGELWTSLKNRTSSGDVVLNAVFANSTVTAGGNANKLAKLFADNDIPFAGLALNGGANLAAPQLLKVTKLSADAASTLDLRNITNPAAFGKGKDFTGMEGSNIIVPQGYSKTKTTAINFLRQLLSESVGKKELGVNLKSGLTEAILATAEETKRNLVIGNLGRGGCNSGMGFAGVFALASLALLGKKRS